MNMTGDPNQINRPTVFGLDCSYPSPVDWGGFSSGNAYLQGSTYNTFSPPSSASPVGNFSFYSNFGSVPSPLSFPIAQANSYSNESANGGVQPTLRCKRKTESPPPVNTKQHITEERMAEHLSKLHISSENPLTNADLESTDIREKRLYMCAEMRKLQTESIIPATLLERMNSPCKALVLWTPPQRPVPIVGEAANNNIDNNNEEEAPDNNLMDLDR